MNIHRDMISRILNRIYSKHSTCIMDRLSHECSKSSPFQQSRSSSLFPCHFIYLDKCNRKRFVVLEIEYIEVKAFIFFMGTTGVFAISNLIALFDMLVSGW
jgi:hypothetical protein